MSLICKVCGGEFANLKGLSCHISKIHKNISTSEYYIQYISNDQECNICHHEGCNNNTTFMGLSKGFHKYCSIKCMSDSKEIKEKRKITSLYKYGYENVSKSEEIKEKIRKTNLERYGDVVASRSEKVKNLIVETNMARYGYKSNFCNGGNKKYMFDKYGVDHSSKLPDTREKFINTCKTRYGVDNPLKCDFIKEKVRTTNIKRYGVCNPMKLDHVKEKIKQTNIRKYGCEYSSQNHDIKTKIRNTVYNNYGGFTLSSDILRGKYISTMISKYGTYIPTHSDIISNKIKDTCIKRYGVDNPIKNSDIKNKIKKTNLIKYGNEIYVKTNHYKDSYKSAIYDRFVNGSRLHNVKPLFTKDEYIGEISYDTKYKFKCEKCGHDFYDHLMDGHNPRCKKCYPVLSSTSTGELEVLNYIKKELPFYIIVENRNTSVLDNKELDIFIKDYRLAIEFNGLYWHSEFKNKDHSYHFNKTEMCNKVGVDLIHIYEDEWIYKSDIVKSILRSRLGLIKYKIHSKKCIVKKVDKDTAKSFMNTNNIFGFVNGNHLGLYYNDELVSMLTYSKPRFDYHYDFEILRFCDKLNTIVVDGLSKLIRYINGKSIVTYVDRRYNTSDYYEKIGFKLIKKSKPSYDCINNNKRFSKSSVYVVNRIYNRIWDCGTLCLSYTKN